MRSQLQHPKAGLIRYGIREIMDLVQQLGDLDDGFDFIGENIGDPVAKGWIAPAFLKEIIRGLLDSDKGAVFGYAHSRGQRSTREWVVAKAKAIAPDTELGFEDVVFVNGLGAGIGSFYRMMRPGARIIQPVPCYPAHVSSERFAAGSESVCYELDPSNGWQPDLAHMESQIRENPDVAGILLINPNNPTGAVYSREILEGVVRIAERHHLMLISDEVYFRMVFNGAKYEHLSRLAAGRVPLVVMRGVSKDVCWPGARCGWMEFHNLGLDAEYRMFFEGIKKALLLEVSATHLPQMAAPLIYDHPQYPAWLADFNSTIESNSNFIADVFGRVAGLKSGRIQGAFYLTALFEDGVLNDRQTLPVNNRGSRELVERLVSATDMPLDKRFAFYLLASTGICVVPMSDFESRRHGFRVTALDRRRDRLENTYKRLSRAVDDYLASH
jgi:alanine-synthesizing transaminase